MFPTVDSEDISQVTSLKEKPSVSSDVRDSSENSSDTQQNHNRDITINMLIKEMVFCIALALTTYGALHNTPSKVSKHPQAMRFFNSGSVVTDWYRGQLGNALAAVNLADVSFIMYYAPWDAESQFVRGEFELAANVLKDRVHFSAINCWNPGSECRLQHNKIPSWPILMAYTVNSRGVLYKGPKDAHSMVNFLELIMKPLVRISSTEDLIHYLSIHDAVAVGYTPLSDTSRFYNTWYNVALKSREFDTVGEICFAVVTSADLAADLGVGNLPNARLMLWNETKEFKIENNNNTWNESTLMHWVLENFAQPVARIIPLWKKSFNFERYADGSPMLILLYTCTFLNIINIFHHTSGPKDAHSMVNFLELIMKPLVRISSTEDLVHYLSIHDAVAVGYTPLSDTSRYYNTWYNVALKSREFDTVGEICFAVVTSADLAADLGVGNLPNARLMLWNETKEFKIENNNNTWNESTLMHWVLENFAQPVARIIPLWKKSFNFERYADGSPMLI
ncbi:Thioredoxin domain-containing protein 11 [Papilio machaon]|uniref:Thioredoxin domain-containing protein 11 n=1 Tax=Papilio machaon TaxID=76193 RepID=A0A194QRK6_PAPMA|nr:Thioredoxin domain-containing protein 11 [Papilio machaon]